mgnify:CR=1 FL=1
MLYRTPVDPAYDEHINPGYDNADRQENPGQFVTLPIWEIDACETWQVALS